MRKTKTEDLAKIKLFNELKALEYNDLQYRCIRLELEHSGSQLDLIRRLVNYSSVAQNSSEPQAFAIKSKDDEEAQEFVRTANSRILPQDSATGKVIRQKMFKKGFRFLDKTGAIYESECAYVPLRPETTLKMIQKNWLHSLETQRELLSMMKANINDFNCNLIRKKTPGDGRFYLMLHVEARKAV